VTEVIADEAEFVDSKGATLPESAPASAPQEPAQAPEPKDVPTEDETIGELPFEV
jgi:hypothetical protein